ncbi:MAG TPA: ATP-binding protein, partial [Methylothermaceae bacterium]|nr:ATP-binding protein [Methylothermaceae bacterium]
RFAIAMDRSGYHVFVMGENGSGRLTLAETLLRETARQRPTPDDWIYLNNFDQAREPVALSLPAGRSRRLAEDIDSLIDKLLDTFPAAFESPSYQRRKHRIEREFNQRYERALDLVERRALEKNVAVFREGDSITFTPLKDGVPMDDAQFAQMSEAEREAFNQAVNELEDYLADLLAELPQWKREAAEKQRHLDQITIRQAIDPLLKPLEQRYGNIEGMAAYFQSLRRDLEQTAQDKLGSDALSETEKRKLLQDSYAPNLFVTHDENSGAPVIYEPHPNYPNLFGHIEYTSEQGVIETNHRMIYAGALHRANGGFLIVEADKLLAEPLVWPTLKRALRRRLLVIERPVQEPSALLPAALSPQPIPLAIKVVIIGNREQYYLLQEIDAEFGEIFKILADFNDELPRDPQTLELFARFLAYQTEKLGTAPLTARAVLRLADFSSRLAEKQHKLSARLAEISDLVCEAEWWRQGQGHDLIDADHVIAAIRAKEKREGRLAEVILEEILDGTILIDTSGSAVGKINGLTVFETGTFSFGSPARISATVYPGSKGIVDIEREVQLGQPIHSKGVMILSGYLGYKYAQKFPFAISAHIALEQSYGYIDGDSAALAEVSALISALTHLPVRQCFAVTGSLNQYGEVQAVGGINVKIEGFFRLCQARGLDGSHGVILPKANGDDLILKDEIIEAVAAGKFHLYPVACVDDALEILMGLPAGKPDAEGNYPKESINGRAVARLQEIAEMFEHEEREKPQE